MVEFDEEQYGLIVDRIADMTSENELPESFRDYFCLSAKWICEVCEYRSKLRKEEKEGILWRSAVKCEADGNAPKTNASASMEDLAGEQRRLYAFVLPENYENSYTDPAYANDRIGAECGGLLSMLSADLMALPVWAAQGRDDLFLLLLQLFVEVYGCVAAGREEAYDPGAAAKRIEEAVYWFYHDYSEVFTAEQILDMAVRTDGFFHRLITGADLSDLRYLYAYGYYVGENEKQLAAYMNALAEEDVQRMADTFTEGYRIGFSVTRKDITKKRTVRIDYPLGMERMVRLAVKNFAAIGLSATFVPKPLLSVQGRGVTRRSVTCVSVNRQFEYDHKEDAGFILDARYANRRIEVMRDTYEANEKEVRLYGGPAVIEMFGEDKFEPVNKRQNRVFTDEQNAINVRFSNESGLLTDKFIPGDEYSFTIISYPYPSIGKEFARIFDEVVKINTLDYMEYRTIQQRLIDLLDRGEWVLVRGKGANLTDMRVKLYPITDPDRQTKFENCVADVNIPVGEVFTSPVLEGTGGTLFVSEIFLGDYCFKNLRITFSDGMITDYTCENFASEEENKKLIFDNILHRHKTLPIGEFAIGTNTTAYRMAKDYGIFDRLPILIAEKTGPHFAVGDTCYSHAEDIAMYNPDKKEVVARDNACSRLRKTAPEKAYFNCHTDITIPFEELGEITVVAADGSRFPLIKDGLFVAEGTNALNEPLLKS